jgi:diphosphomevalonate decarboxylase
VSAAATVLGRATARAHPNIAFVKYWGKRDARLNLPAAGSLSLTLAGASTLTTVSFGETERDELHLDGRPAAASELAKAAPILDRVRALSGSRAPVRVASENDFPTGAGLASSASGLAALALAATRAAGLDLSSVELSALARLGSGSACRSVFGGFVEWLPGAAADGHDSHGVPLFGVDHWDLRCLVAIVSEERKRVGSTLGMKATAESSPYHRPFLDGVPADLAEARHAIAARDIDRLGRVAERSCLRMHAAMMAADPPLLYLGPGSLAVMERVRSLRAEGVPLFFTADAGPNVKVFCEPEAVPWVREALEDLGAPVRRILDARPGPGAHEVAP